MVGDRGFELKDETGEQIKGVFYPEKVQKVLNSRFGKTYLIHKVLCHKTVNGKRLAFVHWKGYSDKFNEWIPVSRVKDL